MKHKVAELEGALLDAAVAKAEGLEATGVETWGESDSWLAVRGHGGIVPFAPSQLWIHGGPIIERERICLDIAEGEDDWCAQVAPWRDNGGELHSKVYSFGAAPLIAAMRAYVLSKFGEEVEL